MARKNKNIQIATASNISVEQQEGLTLTKLNSLKPLLSTYKNKDLFLTRPLDSFLHLMNWVEENFQKFIDDSDYYERLVHNRIIIDGQFLKFAEENNIEIKCLWKDSIVSWNTDNNSEKFFVQGVFKIKKGNCEFLHSALYHKGVQNEDEISFFVVVSNKNYNEYLQIRNAFDKWVQQRDRSNLNIRVIGGEDIPYTKDNSWEDMFLPQDIKNNIKSLVENFLSSKEFYSKNKIPWKRGILLYGNPGNGKTSIIRTLISNYNFKPVTIVPEANNDDIREAFSYAEEQSPSLLYFEDLDSLFEKGVDISLFLNLMDGLAAKNGLLVIATANEIKKLKSNITNRPSRFDRKWEIPLPDHKMSLLYLKKWFGNMLTEAQANKLALVTVKMKFSYAYLKDLYISSMSEALASNRTSASQKDIENALNTLMKDKELLKGSTINTDKYFLK